MIVSPEVIRMIVLSRGILNGLNGMIPAGGHDCPSSILGASDEWK